MYKKHPSPQKLIAQLTNCKGLFVELLPWEPRIHVYDNFKVWWYT